MNLKNTILQLLDMDNNIILENKLIAIPLNEEEIISRSIEYFNDPEPCMIHRSAVMKSMIIELYEYFSEKYVDGEKCIKWSVIPSLLRNHICFNNKKEIDSIVISILNER